MKRIIILNLIAFVTLTCVGQNKNYHSKAIEMNNKGVELKQKFKNDSALILFDKAIELDKTYYLPHANKVEIYLDKNDLNKALSESNICLRLQPQYAEGWVLTGILYDLKGKTKSALQYYQKSLELYNNRISDSSKKSNIKSNKLNRTIVLVLIGKEKEGKQALNQLKSEFPDMKIVDKYLKFNKKDYINQQIHKTVIHN